ncbi:hypothetical protein [Acinetobacter bereziniae]|nr:hypothetical protein [Acinetobacter bereziniae]
MTIPQTYSLLITMLNFLSVLKKMMDVLKHSIIHDVIYFLN